LLPLLSINSSFADVLWLAETPPAKRTVAIKPEANHEHQHTMPPVAIGPAPASSLATSAVVATKKHKHEDAIDPEGEAPSKDHRPGKQVWLRQGDNVKSAAFVDLGQQNAKLTMIDLKGTRSELAANSVNGQLSFKAELPEIGFYDVYWDKRSVSDGKLQVQLPKIELMWASCVSKDVDEEAVAKPIINFEAPLEIVREHLPDEGCMARLVSGDVVKFLVLSFGKPLADVPVTMITQDGWRNTVVTDAAGHAAFTVVRSYFPKWLEFKKYHTDYFLTVAEWDKPESGVLNGEKYASAHYTASLPGKYRPSPHDYRSYAWGLGISLFVVVFGWLSIYLYRRRRLKPYQEVRVDDKA
jgi:hypothetical protein